ncbi:high mobility group box domain-containing protein, partial [Vararia minispora EC-137]
ARIPRPPNAFMLFRSAFIKDEALNVTKEERKQQNLSCLAGEIWNKMSEEHKGLWKARAQAALREHQEKFPQYKYQPAQ